MISKLKNQVQKLNEINGLLHLVRRQNDELLFANLFRDSIQSSDWLKDKAFSPYRSAANYSLMYKLFKIYDVYKPKRVLEFGLGQTTKLTLQYLASSPEASGVVIDDDQEWISVYKPQIDKLKNFDVKKLSIRDFNRQGLYQQNAEYDGIETVIKNNKYNLVIVDGPIGYGKQYSRTNIVNLVGNLAKDWVVIIDDAERTGEQNTIDLLREELKKDEKVFVEFEVSGLKTQHYFCSKEISVMLENI